MPAVQGNERYSEETASDDNVSSPDGSQETAWQKEKK